ncbi:two-component sensor histidine kinase [Marmoricola endophyticus]|uniref:histidine kinase n=1 Tax=Marmoricola endophyticus TaxID=2040280 RepID=A0A917BJE2_9ACTN|nr:ATP-binding protein [Marmoricola endophyticus]GGF47503.1 two-component sensor histidine kinase [Marmoricola endophyticus]
MAERRRAASFRARTTLAATLVVALALLAGAVSLVLLVRGSLREGVETGAEQRAASLAAQVESSGVPAQPRQDEDDDDPEDEVWQVSDRAGSVVRTSQPLTKPIPESDGDVVRLPGADSDYLAVTEDAGEYDVTVAVSLEEVEDSTHALVPPLLIGVPVLLLLVAATTWTVATRVLTPVERIRREMEQITGDKLQRRVPEPPTGDEIHRLAVTVNRTLARLEAFGVRQRQFVADASHELRSPLASIRQTAEVARAHPGALPEGELADTVLDEGARMQRLVAQLLVLTRTDDGGAARERREIDLDDLVLATAGRVRHGSAGRPDADRSLRVDTSRVGPVRVRGDELALTQVVRNLGDNAARHARSTVSYSLVQRGDRAELVVEDDGPGVAEEDRERIFERFVRLDEARARDDGGSGLGLAIVEEIVRAHGGSVQVSRAELGGARFVVLLPVGTAP